MNSTNLTPKLILCASAILVDDIYAVEDARKDPRTLSNPLVAGEFGLQFYAATPLRTSDFYNLGTLCVIDKHPRSFTDEEKSILQKLGKVVMNEMELRLQLRSTVENIDNISSDLCRNITKTVTNIKKASDSADKQEILSYLESSMMYVQNLQNNIKGL